MTHNFQAVLIEDERQVRRYIAMALTSSGFQVWEAETAKQGLTEISTRKPDLVVLDLGLPDQDGIEVVRHVRTWSNMAILILSARTDETQKVEALDAGADDYLTKPFGVPELEARIRAILRRSQRQNGHTDDDPYFEFGAIQVDLTRRRVTRLGEEIHLTLTEYRILTLLITNKDRVLTHRQILKEVWGPNHVDRSHYLRVFMAGLRRKIEETPASPKHILTETGIGYRFV
ncbi:MAG: response regulator [Magnetococcales bacterium]|nr:response regulator [Magnetococcales bacterium]